MSWISARGRAARMSAAVVTAAAIAAMAPVAAQAVTKTIAGSPLTIYVNHDGNLQANLDGNAENVFFPPSDDVGDAALILGFPTTAGALAAGTTAGPSSMSAGPSFSIGESRVPYESVSQGEVTGNGTAAAPFTQTNVYKVRSQSPTTDVATITQIVSYVNGRRSFETIWTIENDTDSALRYRASAAADLYLDGSDFGVGYFHEGPPRVVGGVNADTGRAGGIQESSSSPWSKHQEAFYDSIWDIVTAPTGAGFNDSVLSDEVDNGIGVQWDARYSTGLPAGESDTRRVTWQFALSGLTASPLGAALNQGATHTVTFTATDQNGGALPGRLLRYDVSGPNARAGEMTTNDAGQAAVTWVGANAGTDTITGYLDLNSNGAREADEPTAGATVLFKAPDVVPPTSPTPQTPTAPPNVFTFSGKPIFGPNSTTLIIVAPGPGQISVTPAGSASASIAAKAKRKAAKGKKRRAKGRKKGKRKPALVKRTKVNVKKAGPVRVKVKPTKAGKKVLRRKGKLKAKVDITFTPTGGQPSTVTRKVTIKKKVAKSKKGKRGKGKRGKRNRKR